MNAWHISNLHKIGIDSADIPFWISMVKQIIKKPDQNERVLDYACGDGQFLRLLYNMRPFTMGIGVDTDPGSITTAKSNLNSVEKSHLRYEVASELNWNKQQFDLAFITETLWKVRDLNSLAKQLFGVMNDPGELYVIFGSHTENPLWNFRRPIWQKAISEEEPKNDRGTTPKVFNHSIDEVAKTFYDAGFEVGVKRLPVEYFSIYDPDETPKYSKSLSDLVQSVEEQKMLFYFRRDKDWRDFTIAEKNKEKVHVAEGGKRKKTRVSNKR